MAIGRIGPELAKALLCILLYFWNSCRNPDNNLHVVYPVFTNFHLGNAKSICYFSTNKVLQPYPEFNVQKKEEEKGFMEFNKTMTLDESEENVYRLIINVL